MANAGSTAAAKREAQRQQGGGRVHRTATATATAATTTAAAAAAAASSPCSIAGIVAAPDDRLCRRLHLFDPLDAVVTVEPGRFEVFAVGGKFLRECVQCFLGCSFTL